MAIQKKKYFDVKLNIFNTTIQLLAFKPEDLEGRNVKFDLTKILKGKHCEANYIIKNRDGNLVGEIYQFKIQPSFIRRLIGRNVSIIEDSFLCKVKDANLRIKPFLITRKKVHRSVRKALRDEAKRFIKKLVENKDKDSVFQETILASIQKQLSKKLKKTYPLAVCELRIVKVEKAK
ncbi:MAG: hypothetical protein IB618_03555 [Candidatus Pacearchaeota archaeon]|nr:MAG: hypothetical protein IB618_03555 [Candidatus Pacearchaeota archaeon]